MTGSSPELVAVVVVRSEGGGGTGQAVTSTVGREMDMDLARS